MTTTPAQSGGRTVRTPVDRKRGMADSHGLSAMLIVLTVLGVLVAGAVITGVVVLASYAVAVALSLDVWKPTLTGSVQFVAVVGGPCALGTESDGTGPREHQTGEPDPWAWDTWCGYLVPPALAPSRPAAVLAGLAHLFILDLRDPSSGGGPFDSRPAFEERLRRLRDLIPSGSGA